MANSTRKSLTDCQKDFQDKIEHITVESSAAQSKAEAIFGKEPNLAYLQQLTAGHETPEFVASPGLLCPTIEKRSSITVATVKSTGKYGGKIVRRRSSGRKSASGFYGEGNKFEEEEALQHIGGLFCARENLSEDIIEDPVFEQFFGFVMMKNSDNKDGGPLGLNDLTESQIESLLDNFKLDGITGQFKQLMDRYRK